MNREKLVNYLIYIVGISGLVIAALVIFRTFHFGSIFLERRENSRELLISQANGSIQELTSTIASNASATLAGRQDSSAQMAQLHTQLQQVADAIVTVVERDRTDSLDAVFEKFSMLMAIAALIFGGFGIFTGLQFRQGFVNARREMREQTGKYKNESNEIFDRLKKQSDDFQKSLYDAVDRSMDMIWIFGNSLEHFINIGVVSSETAEQFLADLYKIGFRFELRSTDENERMSAIQNLWAQGDCEDLSELNKIWQNKNESKKMRDLAWLAIKNILKRCKHDDGHSDLFGQLD